MQLELDNTVLIQAINCKSILNYLVVCYSSFCKLRIYVLELVLDQEIEKNYFDMSRFTDIGVHTSVERTNQNCDLGPCSLNAMSVARTSEGCEFDSDLKLKHFQVWQSQKSRKSHKTPNISIQYGLLLFFSMYYFFIVRPKDKNILLYSDFAAFAFITTSEEEKKGGGIL